MQSVEIDRSKRLKEEPAKGHNRWHPDIPPILEVEEGEVVLLNNLLLHRSGVNPTGKQRRAFSAAYMEATTKHVATGDTFPVIFGKNALKPSEC